MFKKSAFIFSLLSLPLFAEGESAAATQSYEFAFLKMLGTLALLLLLLVFSYWMFRRMAQGRMGKSNQSRLIKIIERRSLSPKSVLYVVEFSGKQILIAESQLEVEKIDEIKPLTTVESTS